MADKPNWMRGLVIAPQTPPRPRPPEPVIESLRTRLPPADVPRRPNVYSFDGSFINKPAVYLILNAQMGVLYVGQTNDLGRRIAEHRDDRVHLMHRYGPALVAIEWVSDERGRFARERELINLYTPPCNRC